MKKKKLDKNFYVKIINQYADNYKLLEEENNSLKNENKDLKTNLNVNKEIIESFFKKGDEKNTYLLYLNNLKEEIKQIEEKNEKLKKDNIDLHQKIIKNDNTMSEFLTKKSDRTREIKNRIFILENIIVKKNSIIENLKKKYLSLQETKDIDIDKEPREVYIAEPNENLLILFNDLNLYKEAYEKILRKIKGYKQEIENLKDKLREKNVNNMQNFSTKIIDEIIQKQTKKNWETDEWFAVLNYLNINNNDITNNTHNNKFMCKLLDAIELLNRILIKRNNKIIELEKEIEKLKEKNKDLSSENINLLKSVFMLKGLKGHYGNKFKNNKLMRASGQYINANISMINNISLDENNKIFLLKDLFNKNNNNYFSSSQSMIVENNISSHKNIPFQSFNYSNLSIRNNMNKTNYTQSSDSEILNDNDVLKKLNQSNNLIKKYVRNNKRKKSESNREKINKHFNINSDN